MTGDQARAAASRVRRLRWWQISRPQRALISMVLEEAADTIDRQCGDIYRLRAEVSVESKRRHTAENALDEIVRNEREAELQHKADAIRRELAMREENVVRFRSRQGAGKTL